MGLPQQVVLGNLTTSHWKQKSNPTYTKDLNVEDKSIWLSKYKYLCDLGWGKIFLNKSEMPQNMSIKIDKSDFFKIKFFYLLRDTTVNKQGRDWEKIFATVKPTKD